MATTNIPKRNMRAVPTGRITNYSDKLSLSYKCEEKNLPLGTEGFFKSLFQTTEWRLWKKNTLCAITARGKAFEVTKKFFGVLVTVTGKRILG